MPDDTAVKCRRRARKSAESIIKKSGMHKPDLFDLVFFAPASVRLVRVVYGRAEADEIKAVREFPVPDNVQKEIWERSDKDSSFKITFLK